MNEDFNTWIYPYHVYGARGVPDNGLMSSIWFWWMGAVNPSSLMIGGPQKEVISFIPLQIEVVAFVPKQLTYTVCV